MTNHLKKQQQGRSNGYLPTSDNSSRLEWLDLAKGIGMVLVLIGHAPREWMQECYPSIKFLFCFIYAFHMPFFFALSGMAYEYGTRRRRKPLGAYVFDKANKLLIPWLSFTVVLYISFLTASWVPAVRRLLEGSSFALVPVKEYLFLTIWERNPYGEHIWYIYVLFLIQAMYASYEFVYRETIGKKLGEPFGAILATALSVVCYLVFAPAGHIADCVKTYSMYYLYGILIARYASEAVEKIRVPMALAGIGITGAYTVGVALGMAKTETARYLFFHALMFAGIPCMILFLTAVSQKLEKRGGNSFLSWMGIHSFTVYLLHQPFACGLLGIVLSFILPRTYGSALVIMAVCFGSSIVFPILFTGIGYYLGFGKIFKSLFHIENLMKNRSERMGVRNGK